MFGILGYLFSSSWGKAIFILVSIEKISPLDRLMFGIHEDKFSLHQYRWCNMQDELGHRELLVKPWKPARCFRHGRLEEHSKARRISDSSWPASAPFFSLGKNKKNDSIGGDYPYLCPTRNNPKVFFSQIVFWFIGVLTSQKTKNLVIAGPLKQISHLQQLNPNCMCGPDPSAGWFVKISRFLTAQIVQKVDVINSSPINSSCFDRLKERPTCIQKDRFFLMAEKWVFPYIGLPPKHPKMITFSRKTHGCWVPPFLETSKSKKDPNLLLLGAGWLSGPLAIRPSFGGRELCVAHRRAGATHLWKDRRFVG